MTTEYKIIGMKCGGCQSSVTEALQSLDGVNEVAVSLESATAQVVSDFPLSNENVEKAVKNVGFSVDFS